MTSLIATFYMHINEKNIEQAKAKHLLINTKKGNITLSLLSERQLSIGAHIVQCRLNEGVWQVLDIHQLDETAKLNETVNTKPIPTQTQSTQPKVAAQPATPTPSRAAPPRVAPPAAISSNTAKKPITIIAPPPLVASKRSHQALDAAPRISAPKPQMQASPASLAPAHSTPPPTRPPSSTRPAAQGKGAGGFNISTNIAPPQNLLPTEPAEPTRNEPVIHANNTDDWIEDDQIPF